MKKICKSCSLDCAPFHTALLARSNSIKWIIQLTCKSLLIFFFLLISNHLLAQKKIKKPKYFVHINGGGFIDTYNERLKKNHKGFGLINLGWSRYQEKKMKGIEAEFVQYKFRSISKYYFELGGFQTHNVLGNSDNGLFVGYFGFFGWQKYKTRTRYTKCACFAVGPKLNYSLKLNRAVYLFVGSRLTLVESGKYTTQGFHPQLPSRAQRETNYEVNFLRKRYQLQIGLSFKL